MNYLGVIENAEHVGTLNNAKIYKITNVNMIAFRVSNPLVLSLKFLFCTTVREITISDSNGGGCQKVPRRWLLLLVRL